MLTFQIAIVVGAIIGLLRTIYTLKSHYDGWVFRWVGRPLFGAFVGFFVTFFLMFFVGWILIDIVGTDEKLETIQLASMNSTSGVSGAFVFGSGSIDGQTHYEFLMVGNDGALIPGSVERNNTVRIYEQDRTDAQLVTWRRRLPVQYRRYVLAPGGPNRYDFHVPKGSVQYGFQVK